MGPVPLYHAAAMYMSMIMTHYWDVPTALGIGNRPLTSNMVLECLKYSGSDAVILPPAIVEEMSQMDEAIEALPKLSWVGFCGGINPRVLIERQSAHGNVVKEISLVRQATSW